PYAYARNALKRFSVSVVFSPGSVLLSRDWAALAKNLFLRTTERGGVFHLWGHSWEIDEQGQWENLEMFLTAMCQWREQLKSVTNSELCAYAI
ncbi:MAG: hypothetical protein WBE70_16550, partial [Candidatus Acidiferrum sp.]